MTKKSNTNTGLAPLGIGPNDIIRYNQGKKFFGYQPTQLREKILNGEIPKPFDLSDTGRAKAWTGQQVLDHHRARIAAAKAKDN